ncbi:NAD(P)-binding protein, partial [bacterium]|nr:NAD(P)-binding protein [bacterium]
DAAASSGKRAAVVGAGPAGLAAAFSLRLSGHECVLFDQSHEAGGLMRSMPGDLIEPEAVDSEIECLMAGGGPFRPGWQLGRDGSLEDLRGEYDAVVLALGAGVDFPGEGRRPDLSFAKSLGLGVTEKGVEMDRRSQATTLPGVFVAGEFVTGAANVVRSVASGKAAAFSADQFLRGNEVTGQPRPFCFSNRVNGVEDQISALKSLHELPDAGGSETHTLQGDPGQVSLRDCADEALRCLQCSCAEETTCRLRHYGGEYGIDPYRYEGESRRQAPDVAHPEIIYEPGKCILCGLCLNVAEAEGENIGLAFSGRGFPTRVTVPLGADLPAGLRRAARKCAEACPTAALHIRER